MPLFRYRTRDLASYDDPPCPCGRGFRRLSRIQGRSDDMLIVKGVNIFPLQIDKVLMAMPEVGSHYLVEVTREDFNDLMTVKVEVQANFFQEDLKYLDQLAETDHRGPEERAAGDAPGGIGGAQHPAPERRQGPAGGG